VAVIPKIKINLKESIQASRRRLRNKKSRVYRQYHRLGRCHCDTHRLL